MATKDWKKTKNTKNHIQFEQRGNNNRWAETLNIIYFKPIWEITISYDISSDHHTKVPFKTKTQALKYARAYMRKH